MELKYDSYHLLINWLKILGANSVKILYIHSYKHNYFLFQARDIADHLYCLELPDSSVHIYDTNELVEGEYISLNCIKCQELE